MLWLLLERGPPGNQQEVSVSSFVAGLPRECNSPVQAPEYEWCWLVSQEPCLQLSLGRGLSPYRF